MMMKMLLTRLLRSGLFWVAASVSILLVLVLLAVWIDRSADRYAAQQATVVQRRLFNRFDWAASRFYPPEEVAALLASTFEEGKALGASGVKTVVVAKTTTETVTIPGPCESDLQVSAAVGFALLESDDQTAWGKFRVDVTIDDPARGYHRQVALPVKSGKIDLKRPVLEPLKTETKTEVAKKWHFGKGCGVGGGVSVLGTEIYPAIDASAISINAGAYCIWGLVK